MFIRKSDGYLPLCGKRSPFYWREQDVPRKILKLLMMGLRNGFLNTLYNKLRKSRDQRLHEETKGEQ